MSPPQPARPPKGKGQRKKLLKRCSKGFITTHSVAVECVRQGVFKRPSVTVLQDSTRSASRHQVTIGELRSLLLALSSDLAVVPKYFSVTNKALIRNVINVHITDADDPQALLQAVVGVGCVPAATNIYSARVCRGSENTDGESASTRLLSLSKEDVAGTGFKTPASSAKGSIDAYAISAGMMATWGFPLPEPSPEASSSADSSSKDSSSADCRKRKLQQLVDEDENKDKERPLGVKFCLHQTAVPSKAQAAELLISAPSLNGRDGFVAAYCSRGAAATTREGGYYETLPLASTCYEQLCADLNITCSDSESSMVIAVDCEMCETAGGPALTRLTLVDAQSRILLDTYVLPAEPIVNYNTQYSGIDGDTLAGVTVSLLQAQLAFLRLVSAETLLVGHSLENDLRALKIVHRRVVDTSLLYSHPRGFPYRRSLKSLAEEYLKIGIQNGAGHDSAEDARAALLLAQEKARRGPLFGLPSTSSKNPYSREPLLNIVNRRIRGESQFIICHQPERQLYDALSGSTGGAVAADWTAGREGLLAFARDRLSAIDPQSDSLEADCMKVSLCYFCCSASKASNAELSQLLAELRDVIRDRNSSGYPSSTLLLLTAQTSLAEAAELSRQKKACANPRATAVWSEQLEGRLREAARKANYAALHMEVL